MSQFSLVPSCIVRFFLKSFLKFVDIKIFKIIFNIVLYICLRSVTNFYCEEKQKHGNLAKTGGNPTERKYLINCFELQTGYIKKIFRMCRNTLHYAVLWHMGQTISMGNMDFPCHFLSVFMVTWNQNEPSEGQKKVPSWQVH